VCKAALSEGATLDLLCREGLQGDIGVAALETAVASERQYHKTD